MEYQSGCLICGQELVYLAQSEPHACYYCGKPQETQARCINGHFVCDACHSLSANDLIEQFLTHTDKTDSLELAITLMKNPAIKMHGPEHHFLVPAVLLTAFYNQSTKGDKNLGDKVAWIKQARKRAENVKGGFYGACGAAVGAGIAISVMTGATPLSKTEWKLSNRITGECLLEIAEHGGPRCCKRDTFLALQTAGTFFKTHFDVDFGINRPIQCSFYPMNHECLLSECPFYPSK